MKNYILLTLLCLLLSANTADAKTKKYDNGNVYVGEWSKGQPYGAGTMTYASGDKYVGNWESGNMNGKGQMTYANGDKYVGDWKDGGYDGKGVKLYSNGEKREGLWVYGEFVTGTFTNVGGDQYKSRWHNGVSKGDAIVTYANGDKYDGNLDGSKRSGFGTMKYAGGGIYSGIWSNDNYYGAGTLEYANGDLYKGNFTDGMRDGDGKLTLANGDVFEGKWLSDSFVSGSHYKSNELFRKGEWQDGKFVSGEEVVGTTLPSGVKKMVNIYDAEECVNNVIYYSDGGEYSGEVDGALRQGKGEYTYVQDDKIFKIAGDWSRGNLIKGTGLLGYGEYVYDLTASASSSDSSKLSVSLQYTPDSNINRSGSSSNLLRIMMELTLSIDQKKREAKAAELRREIDADAANAWDYIWSDTEIYRLKNENRAKLDMAIDGGYFSGGETIIYGTVCDIRKFSETKSLYQINGIPQYDDYDFYIVQMDGVAVRFSSSSAVSSLSVGSKVYIIARYSGETFFLEEYPLFNQPSVYNSINEIKEGFVNASIRYPESSEDYRFSEYSKNVYR